MSRLRANTEASADNMFKLPYSGNKSMPDQPTVGTDSGTFTGIALAATMTKIKIGSTYQNITAIPLADGAGTGINPEFEGLAQAAIADAMEAAGYTQCDQITVTLTIVDATPDTFTVAVSHTGEATLAQLYIGGADKTLTRA